MGVREHSGNPRIGLSFLGFIPWAVTFICASETSPHPSGETGSLVWPGVPN